MEWQHYVMEWQQWYNCLIKEDWKVHFETEQRTNNMSTPYFEKFTGDVYIKFPRSNHLEHKYHIVNGDFVSACAGTIKNWETQPTNMQQVVREMTIGSQKYLSRCLLTKAVLYKLWQHQVSQKTLFTQTTREWQTLYNRLNTHDCFVRFRPDWDSYYNEWASGSEEEIDRNGTHAKVKYLENFSGMVFIFVKTNERFNGYVVYDEYQLLMKNGDFYNLNTFKSTDWALTREDFIIRELRGSGFSNGEPENIGLDMKIALLRYWQDSSNIFDLVPNFVDFGPTYCR